MIRLLVTILLLPLSFTSKADYESLQLYEMIIKAEKIVFGEIIRLDSNTFTLQIEGSLTSDQGTITINKFEDWTCASRWTEYQVGQKLFLFLTYWNGNLVSMGGGNEGELPVINGTVYIDGSSIPIPPPPPPKGIKLKEDLLYFNVGHHEIYGNSYFGKEWSFQEFIKDVEYIRNCFTFDYGQYHEPENWKMKCQINEIESKAIHSKLIEWVFKEAFGLAK